MSIFLLRMTSIVLASLAIPGVGVASESSFTLAAGGKAIKVYASGGAPVIRAAEDFAADIGRVSGTAAVVVTRQPALEQTVVVVGVIGGSPELDDLVRTKGLNTADLTGQWESWHREVVKNPWPGIDEALVVVGSDMRGAIYGLYSISEEIGVSPWYWWADVPVPKRSIVNISRAPKTQAPPAVKYRGVFLNDEDFALRPWAAQTLDASIGNIGPRTYARLFELLLRLGANTCWPAMHPGTAEFNRYPENREIADTYGIVMGSSHCEQMLRNNVAEWPHDREQAYNYVTNREEVRHYWEERVKNNAHSQNIYTLGMRGVHDGPMVGGDTLAEKATLMQRIIADQRGLLQRWVNPDISKTPQIFCPYKEVLDIYRAMSDLPKDITLVWPDDNFGYIRRFPSVEEQKRPGGSGIYYHVSYWGAPYDYLWLCSTSPALIHEELGKAWQSDARTMWIVNVGDLKPAEYITEYFLRLARYSPEDAGANPVTFLTSVFSRDFGAEHAAEMASIMADYYALNFTRRVEHIGLDSSNPLLSKPVFTSRLGSDEVGARLHAWLSLRNRAESLSRNMGSEQRDAYFELLLYPVTAAALMNEKWLSLQRFDDYQAQGRASAADWLNATRAAHEAIDSVTRTYNEEIAGGKWRGMMNAKPRDKPVFDLPSRKAQSTQAAAGWGVMIEGAMSPVSPAENPGARGELRFDPHRPKKRSIEIFMRGLPKLNWTATTRQNWIKLSRAEGRGDDLVTIEVDEAIFRSGTESTGEVAIVVGQERVSVRVLVESAISDVPVDSGEIVEDDGQLTMAAVRGTPEKMSSSGWESFSGLGYSGNAVSWRGTGSAELHALEFNLWIRTTGKWRGNFRLLPTWPLDSSRGQRFAIAMDDNPPQVLSLPTYVGERDPQWQADVLRNSAIVTTNLFLAVAGKHRLRIWPIDNGLVFDGVLFENDNASHQSYEWPRELWSSLPAPTSQH
jgi:hypothetical protein